MADLANVDPDVLEKWRAVEAAFGRPLELRSGYRSPAMNKRAKGARRSMHLEGKALDINVRDLPLEDRKRLIQIASETGFNGVGVYNGALHFDTGRRRAWGPTHSAASLPEWAKSTVATHLGGGFAPAAVKEDTSEADAIREEMARRGLSAAPAAAHGPAPAPAEAPDDDERAAVAAEIERRQRAATSPGISPADIFDFTTSMVANPITGFLSFAGKKLGRELGADDKTKAMLKGVEDEFASGLYAEFGDEAAAVANSLFSDWMTGGKGTSYDAEVERIRGDRAKFREESPGAATAANIAGALTSGVAMGPSTVARSLAGRMAQGAGAGAGYGAAYGAGAAEGGAYDRLKGAGAGAVIGGTVGAAFPAATKMLGIVANRFGNAAAKTLRKVITDTTYYRPGVGFTERGQQALSTLGYTSDDIAAISDDVARGFQRSLDEGLAPTPANMQEAMRAAELRGQGITPIRPNVSGSMDDWHFLERARKGIHGDAAAREVNPRLAEQADQVARRVGALGDEISPRPVNQYDAAEIAKRGLEARAEALRTPADRAYTALERARVAPAAGETLTDAIAGRLRQANPLLEMDEIVANINAPVSTQVWKMSQRLADIAKAGKPIPGKLIDTIRQKINTRNVSGGDIDTLKLMKAGFNDWLDVSVRAKLISGAPEDIEALRKAPQLWRAYMAQFSSKDHATKFIAKMVETEASAEQVARTLYGQSALGAGGMTSRQAAKLKEVLGAGSDEWNAVRRGLWDMMTSPNKETGPLGPRALATNIRTFFRTSSNKSKAKLAEVMFSADERRNMLKFADALRLLEPPDGTVNYSNSGVVIMQAMRNTFGGVPSFAERAVEIAGGFADKMRARAIANGIKVAEPLAVSAAPGAVGAAAVSNAARNP